MNELKIKTDVIRNKLTDFIKTELHRADFTKAVVGVSGGIDSSLACYLSAEALGSRNVLAVRMPYTTSSPESLEHAQMVIADTGVENLTIPIDGIVDSLFALNPNTDEIRRGNAMARARMIVLYDQSAAFDGLVIGTGNKTESLLGYTTQYGDSACAINPLGDLYKDQVKQLALAVGVPEEIIEKAPTADLWVGQTDEQELGFTYQEADHILYLLVDQRFSPQECIEAGNKEDLVLKIVRKVKQNHFKRVMPPIANLGNNIDGYNIQNLLDWGV